jgi:hypothetical protein
MNGIMERLRQWRMKAEELRNTADNIQNPFAQASFRRMAASYDRLAEDFERGVLQDRSEPSSRAG